MYVSEAGDISSFHVLLFFTFVYLLVQSQEVNSY